MIRINGKTYSGLINYAVGDDNADLDVVIFGNEDIDEIRNASEIEEIAENYGELGDVIAVYNIVGWRSVSKVVNGMRYRFQTYRMTDINQLKQDNEDLTAALLELAAIVGGGNG